IDHRRLAPLPPHRDTWASLIARAFKLGAEDYVVKPFSPTELAARIDAALRKRAAPELAQPDEPYRNGQLTIDYARRVVTVAGQPVSLTVLEYRLLVELSIHAGRALSHERLLGQVWGPSKAQDSGPVRNLVQRLRRKLGDDPADPQLILSEPRFGYRMAFPEELVPSREDNGS
ncbi:MAG: response regulator transcription factor, partial [Chloroflexi bacterium]|nr:response regulator transcription factor [Chloroflexota bacterium]